MSNQDTYELVTERIVEGLEEVEAGNWETPWDPTFGLPSNRHTGDRYSGINVPLLLVAQRQGGYECSEWLTFKQALDLDGHVRKGESGTKIALFTTWNKDVVVDGDGNDVGVDPDDVSESELDEKGWSIKSKRLPLWKTYTVFNVEQCADVEPSERDARHDGGRHEPFDRFVRDVGADVDHGNPRAAYDFKTDVIRLPEFEAFDSADKYYSTLGHELTHWTGHESRLDRDFSGRFGDDEYAFEELVAELGSTFLGAKFGVGNGDLKDPARYVKHWLEILREDEYAIFLASSKAQDAVEDLEDRAGAARPAAAE